MRHRLIAVLAAVLVIAGPGGAVGAVPTPVFAHNAELLATLPHVGRAISMAFSSDTPHVYVSTLEGLKIFDISRPELPVLVGWEPMDIYQNEAVSLGERPDGTKFVIMASTSRIITRQGDYDTSARFFVIVDVTNPLLPEIVGRLQTATRTHTVSCASRSCEFAYSDGRTQGAMSIVDLRDIRNPKMVRTYRSVVPQGHDQDLDEAGILWHVGGQGTVALDISDPTDPVPLASTDARGVGSGTGNRATRPWNNFIHHNSLRPNASAFTQEPVYDAAGNQVGLSSGEPGLERGNVLLVTEEDVLGTSCGNEGSFQTWYIPYLDADQYERDNPELAQGGGRMEPLDLWTTELFDTGRPAPVSYDCSAHYFDERDGFVVQGWYGQGMRVLDVRDPRDIKQVGYWFTGAIHTWAAYFVPKRLTGGRTIVYTADELRGMDVLELALPTSAPADTTPVRAPVLPQWLGAPAPARLAPDPDWGYSCPLPVTAPLA